MTALFALATSLLWGLADFGGGALTRRMSALTVVVVSQTVAAVVLGAVVTGTGAWGEAAPRLWFAVAAGVAGPVGMFAFYRALALGPMGVVSPLGSVGAVVPVAVGVVLGERPGPLRLAGAVVAAAGVVLACGARGDGAHGAPVRRQAVLLALVAAGAFGTVMTLIAEASVTLPGLFLALFAQRVTNVVVGVPALAASVRRGTPALPAEGFPWRSLPALALVGLADVGANGTYALAASRGPVVVAAVLASLCPVVTAIVARVALRERLRGVQAAGAGVALAGTVLLAAG
ncbi:EamA family transporter [Streptomyces sp. CRN 30]|uniref:EamA family transporter n=1 Tax=Streptomyces sp. CRN 30 TaxID=3075613 RepID=UPI002A81012D|nr:EamA family transporter [Streptomyces sp. CRN 30]